MESLVSQALKSLRILVVDDHDINRDFLTAGLSGRVAEVVTAKDGKAAVELCRNQYFDVVLMDLHMPRMDGLAACERIRQSESASSRARIFILTADARPEEQDRLIDNGADGHLNKPIGIPKLIQAILEQVAPGAARQHLADSTLEESRLLIPGQALDNANGDQELAARMGRLFANELGEKLPLLDGMLKRGEITPVLELLHQWRGTCGFAGAARLHRACEVLRESLQDSAPDASGAAYLEFLRTAHATRQALLSQLSVPS